jgi:prepilin-type N-terminal cleavage/methylation domain-containing protein
MRSKAFWQPSGRVPRLRIPRVANSVAAFSLLELLAVIAILGMLAGIGAPMVIRAQRQARQADCRSNLRQFGIALASYRSDHNGLNPPWLSNLFPEYVDGKDIYVCKSDREARINNSSYDPIPKDLTTVTHYSEIDDFDGGSAPGRNKDIKLNSYFYEFSAAKCSWDSNPDHDMDDDGEGAWWEAKEWQLRYGDKKNDGGGSPENPKPYSTARMPIIRCWHHWQEDKLLGFEVDDYDHSGRKRKFPMVLNVGYAGNVFSSPPWWEGRPGVGEN